MSALAWRGAMKRGQNGSKAQATAPRATIVEVAAAAGVSIKTVSRVVNREASVSDRTREKVEAAIQALGYRPNPSARGLAGNRSYSLGLLYQAPREFGYVRNALDGVMAACEAEDFIADMGGVRTASNDEVATARSMVALAGRLAGVPVLDQVVTDFGDLDRFSSECASARALGYAGKLCIHPGQVTVANEGFVPSADEVARARALLAAYEEASARGVAAIDFEGQMVDEPLAAQARRVIALAD